MALPSVHYVCHTYDSFQKDQIEQLSKNINSVDVFVRTNPLLNIPACLSPRRYGKYSPARKLNLTNIPDNCHVHQSPVYYIPMDFDYMRMGERHWQSVLKVMGRKSLSIPSLVHTHFLWSAGYVGMRFKEEFDIPFVATGHGYDVYDLPFRSDAWRKRICNILNSANHIITVSQANLECLNKLEVTTPISVLPNGFDSNLFYPMDKFECRMRLGLPLDKTIILTVGNCVEVKGHKFLIDAMKQIHLMHPDVLCVIVGTGENFQKEAAMASSPGLEGSVMMVGGKPHEEIPLWMNACDVFVLPSLNEGNPTVLVEALGCGVPFIGSAVGGIPEMICSDKYGLLFDAGDVSGLVSVLNEGLCRIVNDGWNKEDIAEYASKYSWEKICAYVLSIYRELL